MVLANSAVYSAIAKALDDVAITIFCPHQEIVIDNKPSTRLVARQVLRSIVNGYWPVGPPRGD